jgi:hypothetical protein
MNTTTETTTDLPKTGDRFGRLTVIGPVTGGWHVICTCGREYIAEQLVSGKGTEDFQKCPACLKKARKIKREGRPYFTPARRKKVTEWLEALRDGKPVAFDLALIRRMTGCSMEQWGEMIPAARIETLQGILKENPQA